ncbi:MAG: DUF721 domain-containing protein [Alphaproteobacteria bacterium]|nr:DUF721 domain-containing protein [Alphaproteobacteria bacterium]
MKESNKRNGPKEPKEPNERRFKKHPVAAGSILRRATAAALRKRGFGEGEVIAHWAEIVGPRLAALTAPEKLQQRRGDLAGAALHIRVAGAAAVELQHMAPTVIERINGYYGYRAVDRLKLVQGPLPEVEKIRAVTQRALTGAESAALAARTAATKSTDLRQALERLGSSVLGRRQPTAPDD